MPKLKKEYLRLLAAISSLGIEIGVSIVIGYFIGNWLDKVFDTGRILTVIFIVLGATAGFRSLYRISKEVQKDLQEGKFNDIYVEEGEGKDKEKEKDG